MKKNVKLVFLILQICVSIILFTRTVTCQPWDGDSIQLKPYKVLLVSGIQIRDDYVIHQAYDTSDIAALLKIWGIPFDVLRLDTTWMTINHFLNSSGEAEYGTIIWTARQNQYPWQSQDYKVLKQAVEDYNISLIAVGNRIQEPLIQELLGIQFQNWGAISNPVIITASLHFISRNISNTSIPAGEAFAGGNGPRITVSASDTEVLAVSGTWPQLTTRVSNPATRTSSTWIGGNMDSIFCNSPVFIELFKRSLIWAVGYGIYKDYGKSVLLRMDDPGAAATAYLSHWHYPQMSSQEQAWFYLADEILKWGQASGCLYEGNDFIITISGATPDTTYTLYHGYPYVTWKTLGTFQTDSGGNGLGVFTGLADFSTTPMRYFALNRAGSGTQFISDLITSSPGYSFDFTMRDHTEMTPQEKVWFYLADEILAEGNVRGSQNNRSVHIADNYTYKVAAETGFGLAIDANSHYLGEDYVVTLRVCTADGSLQNDFDCQVPGVLYFHDRDIVLNPGWLNSQLTSIASNWPDAVYISPDEWTGYLHAANSSAVPAGGSVQFNFEYPDHYCRYQGEHTSSWTLHLADPYLADLKTMGFITIQVDGIITGTANAADYFQEIQEMTIPAGTGGHSITYTVIE